MTAPRLDGNIRTAQARGRERRAAEDAYWRRRLDEHNAYYAERVEGAPQDALDSTIAPTLAKERNGTDGTA